jgi:hypothetical protein
MLISLLILFIFFVSNNQAKISRFFLLNDIFNDSKDTNDFYLIIETISDRK